MSQLGTPTERSAPAADFSNPPAFRMEGEPPDREVRRSPARSIDSLPPPSAVGIPVHLSGWGQNSVHGHSKAALRRRGERGWRHCASVDPQPKSTAAAERCSTISLQQRNDAAPLQQRAAAATQRNVTAPVRSDLPCVPCPGPHDPQGRQVFHAPESIGRRDGTRRGSVGTLQLCHGAALLQRCNCWVLHNAGLAV